MVDERTIELMKEFIPDMTRLKEKAKEFGKRIMILSDPTDYGCTSVTVGEPWGDNTAINMDYDGKISIRELKSL